MQRSCISVWLHSNCFCYFCLLTLICLRQTADVALWNTLRYAYRQIPRGKQMNAVMLLLQSKYANGFNSVKSA